MAEELFTSMQTLVSLVGPSLLILSTVLSIRHFFGQRREAPSPVLIPIPVKRSRHR